MILKYKRCLRNLHQNCHWHKGKINLNSNNLIILFSFSSSTAGRPSVLGPGFSNPPGGDILVCNKTSIINNYPFLGAAYLNRTVMSYHYYCWALGYASDESIDPILTTVCDDVNIEIF